ncbi:MAG TPA: methyltransferase domain-containing protein [Candidatus Saccharimonadales bacterium]|nr:methyltransferase domain-containing protein [Candidatus Saccharimonadales bacterium]
MKTAATWPKSIPPLSEEQKRISDDFMRYWHEVLPKKYGVVEEFNHRYPVLKAPSHFKSTLEIGAGLGEHLQYEQLTSEQEKNYVALELRPNMAERIKQRFPNVQTHVGDCQERLDFASGHFDRILAIHVLEHLPNLPAAVKEMHRLCHPRTGIFSVVIPCEGGLAYSLARKISARRIFERRYNQSYNWFIEREHINEPDEILQELSKFFAVQQKSFFPLRVPAIWCNLCIGLTLRPRDIG